MGTKKETGRSRSPERDPWKGLLVHSLVIQSLHVLDGGDSGVDGDVAALHCVDGHLGDLVLLERSSAARALNSKMVGIRTALATP